MYRLYEEMSDTSIGKNPLSEDHAKLDEFYTRWVTQIDGIIGMIDWGTQNPSDTGYFGVVTLG